MRLRFTAVFALAFSATFACGEGSLSNLFPRLGTTDVYSDSTSPVLAMADTDGAARFYDLSRDSFASYAAFVGFADIEHSYPELLLPVHLTEAPHSFDGGDWAFALGLFNEGGGLHAYLQLRVAGSSATVSPLVSLVAAPVIVPVTRFSHAARRESAFSPTVALRPTCVWFAF